MRRVAGAIWKPSQISSAVTESLSNTAPTTPGVREPSCVIALNKCVAWENPASKAFRLFHNRNLCAQRIPCSMPWPARQRHWSPLPPAPHPPNTRGKSHAALKTPQIRLSNKISALGALLGGRDIGAFHVDALYVSAALMAAIITGDPQAFRKLLKGKRHRSRAKEVTPWFARNRDIPASDSSLASQVSPPIAPCV